MEARLWSDCVTHYYLTCIVGLRQLEEMGYLVMAALSEATPQYAKSRIATVWACVGLDLDDQLELLYELSNSLPWAPLRWSCGKAFAALVNTRQVSHPF